MTRLTALLSAILAVSAATTGCKKKAPPPPPPVEKVHVETADVREQTMPRTIPVTGTLHGQRQTDLAADANGKVLETLVERGAQVKKGDVIAKLDVRAAAAAAAEAHANVAVAKAQAESAERDCERYRGLLAKHAITQAEFDRAADACKTDPLAVRAAEARAHAASLNVTDGTIRAPFNGYVAERQVDVGQYVHPDTKVATVVELDPLRLEITVPEIELAAVKPGVAITFTVAAFRGKTFEGTVKFVSPAVREATRDVVAEAEVPNPDHALLPGMFAEGRLAVGEEKDPVVPKAAVTEREDHQVVFAVVAGHIEERLVQLGATKGDDVAVRRGVKPGEKVVLHPDTKLWNGAPVD
ncbi:MAG TPA: efflux RND transporter periplasmic adaptor subunit [Minicystis sp.]|nr:efflux RND transporter periplasmic adaptor subunit [Minicystis sp.]